MKFVSRDKSCGDVSIKNYKRSALVAMAAARVLQNPAKRFPRFTAQQRRPCHVANINAREFPDDDTRIVCVCARARVRRNPQGRTEVSHAVSAEKKRRNAREFINLSVAL